jgi:O-antigen/teichoic acid export membrane protein
MLNIEKRLFKDSSLLIVAQTFNKGVGFFYNVFLAKALGVGNFGEYILALSVFGLMGAVADLGMNQWLVRQVAIDPNNKIRAIEVLFSRYLVAVIGFVGMLGYLIVTGENSGRGLYLLLAVAAVLPQVMGATLDAVTIGLRKFGVSAVSLIFMSMVQVLLGVWFTINWGVTGSLVAFLVGQVSYGVILLLLIQGINFRVGVTRRGVLSAISASAPFGLLMLIGMAYARLDAILLGVLKGTYDVGLYGAGYKFFEAVSIIPSAVGAAIYPYFAKLYQENPKKLNQEFVKIIGLLVLISLPIILGYWVFVPWVISQALPGYAGSIEVVKVLSLGIPFYFAHNVVSVYLLSRGQGLSRVVILSTFVLMFNGALNYLLIPQYGYMASAWVGVMSEIVALAIYFSYAKFSK